MGEIPNTSQFTRARVFLHALAFVVGFSLIFIIGWGGAATLLGQVFGTYKSMISKIGGVIVILFGLSTLGMLKISWWAYVMRPEWSYNRQGGFLASGLMGMFFSAGWIPCIGTTLGAILTMGFNAQTSSQAIVLSSGYAIGIGIPFVVIGLGMDRATGFVYRFQRHLRKMQVVSGILLLTVGVMLLTDQLTLIAVWAQRNGFFLNLPFGTYAFPTYFIALFAGLLSFFSPCVLPLVPAYIGYLSGHAFKDPQTALSA